MFYGAQILSYNKRLGEVHSLALRMAWDGLHRPEESTQLLLGLDNGLRGYATRRFDGSRRFIFNAELRPTFYRHRWYTVAGVFFLDAGAAWVAGSTPENLRWSPGLGLRLGLPWVYNTPVWRLDLARDTTSDIWRLSVGLGPYF